MKNLVKIAVSVVALLHLASCSRSRIVSSVEREDLFSLEYGNFEDELNLFDFGHPGEINTNLCMRDGFFYIMNGEAKKIMEMNSYGNLLTLYYNDETNPHPSFAGESNGANSTRNAVPYPFNDISLISVDSRKHLYVVERLPLERQENDAKSKVSLSQVVLHFDENKKFVSYIGQQGPGGTPFSYIKNIYTTDRNELVVVCTTQKGMTVYWYSADGFLLYTIPVEKQNIPNPFVEESSDYFYSLDNIVPDYRTRTIYLKVDYFSSYVDASSRVQSGIEYVTSLIHPFKVEENAYEMAVTIPPYSEEISEGFSKESYDIPYDFLGVTESGWLYFIVSTQSGFTVQMVQSDGQRILKRNVDLNREANLYYSFNLSREGIISVLLVEREKASVAWWRADSLIQAVIKN
ncbi:LIC_12708 family protein [Treponema sp.]|uniref:LIC_12708 family protein n=1 Tax=Treponema sp. TaxID=166 RepID=UPI00388D64B8